MTQAKFKPTFPTCATCLDVIPRLQEPSVYLFFVSHTALQSLCRLNKMISAQIDNLFSFIYLLGKWLQKKETDSVQSAQSK